MVLTEGKNMKRKQITTGIWLIVIAVISVTILKPNGNVLIIGWIPVVTPVSVMLEVIGITLIVTAWASGWTKKIGIAGAVIVFSVVVFSSIVSKVYQTDEEYMATGLGALIIVPLFMALGKMIDQWLNEGFHQVRFRLIGALIGLSSGISLAILNPPASFIDYLDNTFPLIVFIPLGGLILGWLIDYVALSGSKVFNSIYRCEILLWTIIGIIVGIVLAIFNLGSEMVFPLAIGMPISFYGLYICYLYLWRLKKPWNWLSLFFLGGALFLAFSFLVIGDAVRRGAALFYRGDRTVHFAFGGLTQPEALKAIGPLIKTLVAAIAVLSLYGGLIYWIIIANSPPIV